MVMQIMDWRFEEDLSNPKSLRYIVDADSIIEVKFDNKKAPQLIFKSGAVCWTGLPEKVEKQLKEKISSKYPDGFHTRPDYDLPWLCTKKKEIENELGGKIRVPNPFGGLNIDGVYVNAYKTQVKFKGDIPAQEVIIGVNTNKIYVFKKYMRLSELQSDDNFCIVYIEDPPIKAEQTNGIISFDKYIVLKEYVYERDEKNKEVLKTVFDCFRNDVYGNMADGDMGKYLPLREMNDL